MLETSNGVADKRQWNIEPKKRLFAGLALGAIVLLVALIISNVSGSANDDSPIAANPNVSAPSSITLSELPATIVSKDELLSLTKDLGFVIYWNGEMPDTNLELTILAEGKVFVRYLPKEVPVGAAEPYFTVASYYDPEGFAKIQNVGATAGAKLINYSGGAAAASASEADSNIYFGFDGYPALYNIYAPDPQVGWSALESGTISILQ